MNSGRHRVGTNKLMTFDKLGLSADILRAVAEQGYTKPTPVQAQAIPVILEGHDILIGAQTGTGKTAGFTLPMLALLGREGAKRSDAERRGERRRIIRVLVLVPTRELAAQVNESITTYGKYLPLRSTSVFGGVGINPQIRQLDRGVDILVATPGRLLDLVNQKTCDLSNIGMLVLDEADRMLDMGFIHDIRRILALLPKRRQNLLFSATFSDSIKRLASGILNSPRMIEVSRNEAAHQVTQVVHPVDKSKKRELLSHIIHSRNLQRVLVFTRTKHGANRLASQLERDGIRSTAIHGNKSQTARTRALADFKRGRVCVLVATDIAARGLDIDQLPHVVNYELPNVSEDYVHRIGRTGRAGRSGEAMSLVCSDELKLLHDIERLLRKEISRVDVPGYAMEVGDVLASPRKGAGGQRRQPLTGRGSRSSSNRRRSGSSGRQKSGRGRWSSGRSS